MKRREPNFLKIVEENGFGTSPKIWVMQLTYVNHANIFPTMFPRQYMK